MEVKRWLAIGLSLAAVVGIGVWLAPVGWGGGETPSSPPEEDFRQTLHSPEVLLPLPVSPPAVTDKAILGRRLFHDKRLSHDDSISCASCHDLTHGGVDGRALSLGVGGKLGTVNAPTVFNGGLNFVQFWDGRAATLEEQAAGPVLNPLEMASSWDEVVGKLGRDEGYRRDFAKIYGAEGIGARTIADALAAFERTLLTPNSRFDRYLRGDKGALNETEAAGYARFLDYGCASCHQGVGIGGNMFQTFGIMDAYPVNRRETPADLGRFNVTGREEDRHVFKVPSLRNVALTAPYFHDGSARTLEEAVTVMGHAQLGRNLTTADVTSLVAFLKTLTGEWEGRPLR